VFHFVNSKTTMQYKIETKYHSLFIYRYHQILLTWQAIFKNGKSVEQFFRKLFSSLPLTETTILLLTWQVIKYCWHGTFFPTHWPHYQKFLHALNPHSVHREGECHALAWMRVFSLNIWEAGILFSWPPTTLPMACCCSNPTCVSQSGNTHLIQLPRDASDAFRGTNHVQQTHRRLK
jgi:hypothetical protein